MKRIIMIAVLMIVIICSLSGCKNNDVIPSVPDQPPAEEEISEPEVALLNSFTDKGRVSYTKTESEDGLLSVSVHCFDFEDRTVSTFDCIPCGYVINPILFVLDDKVWLFSDCVYIGAGNFENYGYEHLCYVIDLKTKTMSQMTYDGSVDVGHGFGILTVGDKKYLIADGVDHGTEEYPSYGNSYMSHWILDLDSLTFEPYDGTVPVNEYKAGYSLKADANAKYIGSNSRGKYFYSYSKTSAGENYLVDGVWALWCQSSDGEEYIVAEDMFPKEHSKPLMGFQSYASVTEDFVLYPSSDWEGSGEEWNLLGTSYFAVDLKDNTVRMIYEATSEEAFLLWFQCEYGDFYVFSLSKNPMSSDIIGPSDLIMIRKDDFLNGDLDWPYFKKFDINEMSVDNSIYGS